MKKLSIDEAKKKLDMRVAMFKNAPTASNTILLKSLMDTIILSDFKDGKLEMTPTGEKSIIKLEKLWNLALNTKFNAERVNAVDKCMIQYYGLMGLRIEIGV